MPARRRLIPDHAYSFFPVLFPPLSDFRRRSAARSRRPPKEQPPEAQSPEAQSPAPANAGYALPAARCKTNETHPKALRSRAEHPSGRDRCGELRIMRLPQTARPKAGSRSPPCRKSAMRHLPPIRLHAPGHDESDKKTKFLRIGKPLCGDAGYGASTGRTSQSRFPQSALPEKCDAASAPDPAACARA